MLNKKRVSKLFVIVLFTNLCFSQNNFFSGKDAWLYDSVLSSDQFQGRKTGTVSASESAKWIAEKFNEWGLKAGGDNNNYIQKFSMLVTEEKKEAKLIIKNARRGELVLHEGDDFAVFTNSGSASIESDALFLGYGISEPDMGWDDYSSIDVKGKIVVVIEGAPDKISENMYGPEGRNYKFITAQKKGAIGFLMYRSSDEIIKGASIEEKNYNQKFPGTYIMDYVLKELFKSTGKTFDEIKNKLIKGENQSFDLGKRVSFFTDIKKTDNGIGENVLGIIPGYDPILKDEYIVFGAHMDHLGKSSSGYTYFGSDDNGSGTAVVMELARSLIKSGIQFKRSIIFAGFGGEEQGLLGSNFFVSNPTVQGNKIAAMINFDMVGVGDGGVWIAGIESIRKQWNEFWLTLGSTERKKIYTARAGLGGSDYTGFKIAGIPALTSGSSGSHQFYHVVEDDYKYVQPEVMDFVGTVFFKLGKFLGEYNGTLLHPYRNEKSLLSSCNISNFKSKIDIQNFKNLDFGKTFLEKNIKLCRYKLFELNDNLNCEDIVKDIFQTIQNQKENKDYSFLSMNSSEARGSINGSKLVIMPYIDIKSNDSNKIKLISKLGLNYFKVDVNKQNLKKVNQNIYNIKNVNGIVELNFNDKIDLLKDIKLDGKIIINESFKLFSSEENRKTFKQNSGITLFIINIDNNDNFSNNIVNIIKELGKKKIHLEVSSILIEDENKVYEMVKTMKSNGLNDTDIRNIFGDNLMRVF